MRALYHLAHGGLLSILLALPCVLAAAPRVIRFQQKFMEPEPDGTQRLVGTPEDAESVQQSLDELFSGAPWPGEGKDRWPSDVSKRGSTTAGLQFGAMIIATALLSVLGCSALVGYAAQPPRNPKCMVHFKALLAAIVWRHTHQKALIAHLIRIAVPSLFLLMISRMQNWLAKQVHRPEASQLGALGNTSPENVADAISEYLMTVTILYLSALGMLCFVWHVAEEMQSGFRHLLHVSGLSRAAYIIATGGIGFLQSFLGIVWVVLISGTLLELRMVLWSSPSVLFLTLAAISSSSAMTGYLLCLLCPSVRFSSNIALVVLVLVILCAPFSPAKAVVPEAGQQSWMALALPVIPAYRSLFELVAGCTKGRCLTWGDLSEAFWALKWAGPGSMSLGTKNYPLLTPPEAMISFLSLVAAQNLAGWLLVVFLDRRLCPALKESANHLSCGDAISIGASNKNSLLEVRDVKHSYGWLGSTLASNYTLKGVSFGVARGEMLGLLGPNGAGKTTLIKCITGEEAPSEGSVAISSETSKYGDSAAASLGLCPQETVVSGDLTVQENLLFFAAVRGAGAAQQQLCVEAMLRATRLEEKRDALPCSLSGGMRRRLAIGCAMVASPTVVVLDEPTTGLDPLSRRGIWESICEVKDAGGCCLLTTHMLEEAECLASHIVIMQHGSVAAQGSVQQLKNSYGMGYMLSVDSELNREEDAKAFISSLLEPEDRVPIKSNQNGQVTYKFTQDEEALGRFIISVARGKANQGIKHWGVSQASLEDAYVRIIQQD
eukprot:TRINITY_DN28092_c0_g1_i1.p1 TRINITY_DN28092_c0_g1~~TRINITY_DN28092_c0_g1_i1.p1  ORF type:complete len:777 (+),score=148.62 TRINITY_DN28092_c0_g1_i1:103-2433(+)